jgi:DNA-binding NtrC family response regulator
MNGRVLVVDDDQAMCELIEADLRRRGFEVTWHSAAEPAFEALKQQAFDVVLTDLNMPGMDGIELCHRIVENRPGIPVVVITAFGSLETAVAAIRAGAYDFVTKPIEMDMLLLTIERAVRHSALQEKVKILSELVQRSQRFDDLLGASRPMERLYDQMTRVADSGASVLITGESGTGKELVARSLHQRSARRAGPFVAINCAALPESLLESELFGHKKGAFTDARADRSGLFVQADGGTLLLDEIGDFPLALQAKLLRALESGVVRPIGGDRDAAFDVRVLAATNRDLETAVDDGRFRQDLFFRINVIQLEVPPLCSRGTDILLLAQHFLEHFVSASEKNVKGISDAVADKLLSYDWPGNVRELRNAIERAVVLTRYETLTVEDLPERIRNYRSSHVFVGGDDPSELLPMEAVEERYIRHVLKVVGGNKALASRVLGFDRKTLYRKLERIDREAGADASRTTHASAAQEPSRTPDGRRQSP